MPGVLRDRTSRNAHVHLVAPFPVVYTISQCPPFMQGLLDDLTVALRTGDAAAWGILRERVVRRESSSGQVSILLELDNRNVEPRQPIGKVAQLVPEHVERQTNLNHKEPSMPVDDNLTLMLAELVEVPGRDYAVT